MPISSRILEDADTILLEEEDAKQMLWDCNSEKPPDGASSTQEDGAAAQNADVEPTLGDGTVAPGPCLLDARGRHNSAGRCQQNCSCRSFSLAVPPGGMIQLLLTQLDQLMPVKLVCLNRSVI